MVASQKLSAATARTGCWTMGKNNCGGAAKTYLGRTIEKFAPARKVVAAPQQSTNGCRYVSYGMNRSYHSKPENGDSEPETAQGSTSLPLSRSGEIEEALSAHGVSNLHDRNGESGVLNEKRYGSTS